MTEKNAVLKHQRGREGYHNGSCRRLELWLCWGFLRRLTTSWQNERKIGREEERECDNTPGSFRCESEKKRRPSQPTELDWVGDSMDWGPGGWESDAMGLWGLT